MRDVTYIPGKDHSITVPYEHGFFNVTFFAGEGGHYPEHKTQEKPGKATVKKWVKGIPDDVADWWVANGQPWEQGIIVHPPKPKPKAKAQKVEVKK